MDITVLTVPRSGTHFLMYFLLVQLGIVARYAHIRPRNETRISAFLDSPPHPVIVTIPNGETIKQSINSEGLPELDAWIDDCIATQGRLTEKLRAVGALPFNVERSVENESELNAIASAVGVSWTAEHEEFLTEWPRMGVRQSGSRMDALRAKINDTHRGI